MKFDIVMVIALVAAVVVFFQLRSVLGKRTGFERPPLDPRENSLQKQKTENLNDDNIIALPKSKLENDDFAAIDALAASGTVLNQGLRAIKQADRNFAPQSFVDGVRVAYEMIVSAFAKGDKTTLQSLLADDVFEGFAEAIDMRDKNGEKIDFTFIAVDKADIIAAEMQGTEALISLRIVSEIISATYDNAQNLVDGDPQTIAEITDIWTFARNSRSNDPNWKLVSTQDPQE